MNELIIQKEIETIFEFLAIPLISVKLEHDDEIGSAVITIQCSDNNHSGHEFRRDFSMILRFLFERKHNINENFILDINGEQKKIIEFTKQKARIAAKRVRSFGKEYEFGPLSSYERMIVHSVIKQEPGVQTESRGEGNERRLFVTKQKT